jgi:hypothetical protein
VPIERENIGNFSGKKSYSFYKTRIYKDADPSVPQTPLLYAGILLEGGIVL